MQLLTDAINESTYQLIANELIASLYRYSAHQDRLAKMLPLFPVEYVRNCSIIYYFNSTATYKNKNVIFWSGSFS